MLDLTSFASWAQIISVPLAILAIAISILLYYRSKQKRSLACIIESIDTPIAIKVDKSRLEGDVEIRYKGQIVENIFIVRATFTNTGNTPLKNADFVEPLTFSLDNVRFLRQPRISNMKPENLSATLTLAPTSEALDQKVTLISFNLLNPQEEFTVEFVCTGKPSLPIVKARIEGITQIELLDRSGIQSLELQRSVLVQVNRIFVVLAVISFIFIIAYPFVNPNGTIPSVVPNVFSMVLGYFAALMLGFVRQDGKK